MNPFKDRLKTGEPLFGNFLGLAHPLASEVSAPAGFDWLLIDGEHAPNDLASIVAQANALARHDPAVFVRIRDRDPAHLKQLLDVGIRNFLVPVVDTKEQAEALALATRYPPEGNRGVGMLGARATNFGRNPGYLKDANKDICLLVQIETRLALSNMEAIMGVEGIDGVFFGPADIAASMGKLGQITDPDLWAAIHDTAARVKAAGGRTGTLVGGALIGEVLARDYDFVAVGVDMGILVRGAAALLADVRAM